MIRECNVCGKEYSTHQYLVNKGFGLWCSKECRLKERPLKVETHFCETCGSKFQIHISTLKARPGAGKYCSVKCRAAAQKRTDSEPFQLRVCKTCGKEFLADRCQIELGFAQYCSQECAGKGRRKRVSRVCLYCGKEFEVRLSDVKNGGGKFCSRKCKDHGAGLVSKKIRKPRIKISCKNCGIEFEVPPSLSKTKFCSKLCSDMWKSKRNRGENHPQYKPKIKKKCPICGNNFEVYPSLDRIQYCSHACRHIGISGSNAPLWKGGISFDPYCEKFNKEFRARVRAFFGYRCVLCGKHESEFKRKLSVHHVYYDKDSCCSDAPREFVTLCTSCHSKTNYNRSKWQDFLHSLIHEKYGGRSYLTKEEMKAMNEKRRK